MRVVFFLFYFFYEGLLFLSHSLLCSLTCFILLVKSENMVVHLPNAPAEGNCWRSAPQEKGSSNFPITTVGALCCCIEKDDTSEHSSGNPKHSPLLICLRRCFPCISRRVPRLLHQYFFKGAACSLLSTDLWFICQMRWDV